MSQKCCHIPPLPPKFNVDVRKSFGGGRFTGINFANRPSLDNTTLSSGGRGGAQPIQFCLASTCTVLIEALLSHLRN